MAKPYKISVRPSHERDQIISAQLKKPLRKHQSFDVYEGVAIDLDVIRLEIDVPIYRMANGRTQTEQLAHIAASKLPANYFSAGEENESVQQVQHNLLWAFAKGGSKSVTPIADVLSKENQREPILITPRGVVVNGNRRLAAMRELVAVKSEFATIECAVLPHLTPDQILEIEVRLQMRPETKLDYGWVDECLMIRRLLDSGKDEAAVAKLIRKKSKDVKAAIAALSEAEIYLHEWLKAPKDYRKVKDDEQFFYDFPRRLKGKSGELLEASRRIGWVLVQNSGDLGQRVYSFNAMFGEKAPEVLSRLAERMDIDAEVSSSPSGAGFGELEVDLGESVAEAGRYDPIIRALDDQERREEFRDELVAVCQTMLDAKRTADEGKRALTAVKDANTILAEVDFTVASPDTFDAIDRQLDEIERRASELKSRLADIKAKRATKAK